MKKIELVNVTHLESMPRTPLTTSDVAADHMDRFTRHRMTFEKDLELRGKYCYHPFNTVTIDSRGDCYVCTCQAWLPISMGNILEFDSLTAIVQSARAREIQASIIDGTYKYCDHKTCHLITSNRLEGRIDHRPDTVNWIVFAIDDSCNLTCPSCRTDMIFYNRGEDFDRRMRISDHLVKLIQEHDHFLKFTLSGDGDPFASHVYRNLLEKLDLSQRGTTEIEIVTNGILAKDHWHKMSGIHKSVMRFKISFDAGSPEVYAQTRRGGNWNKLIESAEHIIKWKQKNYSDMELVANFVVQTANFRDIHRFVKLALDLGFDEISFQKVTDWGKWYDNGINRFVEHAVWMPDHENYQELVEIVNDPVMTDRKINLTNLSHLRKTVLTLSELVDLKNSVNDKLNTNNLKSETDRYKTQFEAIKNISSVYKKNLKAISDIADEVSTKLKLLDNEIEKINTEIDQEINSITANYHQRGYKVNGHFATNRTNPETERGSRKLPLSEETSKKIIATVQKFSDWKYPALEIGPGDGIWTEHLVANEPLYLVDIHWDFLESTKSKFNAVYQNRLRLYKTNETDLSMLPQNQFGFVFSWNVFNYLTTDLIDQYLKEIFSVLRPGGVCMFSYNNAERTHCAKNVELGYMSYMPKKLLTTLIHQHGFEIIGLEDRDETISWAEIRKPGVLSTIKAHPVLGEIIQK
jgi:phospholipid N-methyltransferase/organic radical activating enzyme